MEFGNEMQATFNVGIEGGGDGFARASHNSNDQGQQANFGNQPLDAGSPHAPSTKGFLSAAQRGYERQKLPQSKS